MEIAENALSSDKSIEDSTHDIINMTEIPDFCLKKSNVPTNSVIPYSVHKVCILSYYMHYTVHEPLQ